MYVLIPSFEPTDRLPELVARLAQTAPELDVLVVDDGSGPSWAAQFDAARASGAEVIAHERNRGKGAALKTGLGHIAARNPRAAVVTADSDGQHTVADILRVAETLRADADAGEASLVLGVRLFRGRVPLRSRVGNAVAVGLFRAATGRRISDTQTGLRGIPAERIGWARRIPGEGFEYEQRMLLRLGPDSVHVREVPIATVYLDRNASSHFRPVRDSLRVLLPVLLFAGSSFAAFLIDTAVLLVMEAVTGWLIPSIIVARTLSATANFLINRRAVFRAREGAIAGQAVRYALLASALLASNIAWMSFLTSAGFAVLPAKVITEGALFVLSYGVQRSVVFARTDAGGRSYEPHSNRRDPADAAETDHISATGGIEGTTTITGRTR